MSEKVDLCSNMPLPSQQQGHAQDPVRCLQAVEAASKAFKQAPKKALGYFLENLWDARDRKSRELLIHMCSFGSSHAPLASAECFKSAPNSLDHGMKHIFFAVCPCCFVICMQNKFIADVYQQPNESFK